MSGRVVLHGYFRSSAAFRVRIALNLKCLAYESRTYHLRKSEQRAPGYLGMNPQGLVPTLEIDGKVLVQSVSIIEYLDETRPRPALQPAGAAERARCRALAQLVACDIHPLNNLRVLQYLRTSLGVPETGERAWYSHWLTAGFDAFEALLQASPGPFCCGELASLADACLIPQVFNAQYRSFDMSPYPRIRFIFDHAMRLPEFAEAAPNRQPDAEA
jgi:maleylacetoacetate isomerase